MKFRGSQGSVSLGGNLLGEITGWELNPSRPVIDATRLTDTAKRTGLDIPGGTGTLTAFFDAGDTAQDAILDILLTNTDAVTLAAIFTVASGKTISVNIVPTSAPISAQRGRYIEVSFSFETDGGFTVAWA